MKLAHKYALDAILKENQDIKGIIVYAPAMEWNVPLLQRPQHLAFQMAAKGYLYFYCTDNRNFDKISGFEKITDRCYVTDQHDLITQSDIPFIYNLNSICPIKIDRDIFERINENHITIYDYIDHIHEYISGPAAEFIYRRHMLINPDIITCTARVLVDEMLQRFPSDKVYYLPNAAEYEHFHIKKEVSDLPEDIKHIVNKNKPIIGYFGALAKWIDYNLINLLAEKRPDAEIILIGWDFDGSQKLLKDKANLHILGTRPYAILPKYAIWFDIAIIPFSDVDISSTTSPIKLYEYMALGKPIVTTDVFECKRYRSVMAAQDHEEFLLSVDRGFKLKDNEDYLKLLDFEAKQNTWEARASELEKAIVLRQQRVDNMGYRFRYIKEPLVVHEPNDRQPLSSKSSEILEGEKVDRDSCKYNIPMVSIIIPTCDRPGFLKEALQSVLSQTYKNFEIIVINDGGRDISEDINSLENSGKIIYLQHESRRGPSAARNAGLKQARGKYIAYLDDDDIYYPIHLETLVVFLERNNYKVAYTDSYQMFQTWITDRYVTTDKKITYSHDFDRQDFLISNYIHIINIVYRREILDEIGLFDEGLETHEDWDMCIRLSQKYDFYHIKAVTAEFRTRDDMSSATNIKRVDFLRTLKLIHKRYSHLVTDPNILEAQKKLEKSLAMEVEIRQVSSSLMEYERLHQYRFAKEFVKDKKVLVLGGGKGYGSFILSEDAESVKCIDKDERNIRYGSANYIKENLEFIKGSITDVPVKEEKIFDVIVCFEALEQIEEHNELMKEVKRLLKDDGIFIVSSSNKYISSDQTAYQKPLPLKELSFDDFKSLLKKNFKNTLIYGQKVYPSSNIFPLFKSSVNTRDYTIEKGDKAFLFVPHERKEARYLIAVSSDGHIEDITGNSYLVDISETLSKLKDGHIRNLGAAIREKDAHTANLEAVVRGKNVHISNLEDAVRAKDAHISNLETVIKDKDLRMINLEAAIRDKESHISNLEATVRDKDTHVTNLETAVRGKEATLNHIYNSRGWKALLVYYRLRNRILPVNSRRRLFAKIVFNIILNPRGIFGNLNKKNLKKFVYYLKADQQAVLEEKIRRKISDVSDPSNPYQVWIKNNEPSASDIERFKNEVNSFKHRPKISIITPVYNTDEQVLIRMMESVLDQIYTHWELCIAEGGSTIPHVNKILKEYAEKDNRIKVKFLPENKGIAGNSNEALSLATGEFVGFLDHDDELAPWALYEVVKLLNENQNIDFIYSDEDKIATGGKRFDPHFKPDWSPDTLRSYNYITHFAVIRKRMIDEVDGFWEEYEGSQDHDLFLRIIERTQRIAHIPKVLYHWRANESSTGGNPTAKMYAYDNAKKALMEHIRRIGLDGEIDDGQLFGSYRIRYRIDGSPMVSIIIPTKDNVGVLKRCINSILRKGTYKNYRIYIVDNQSSEEETFRYYKGLQDESHIKILRYDNQFNFSALINYAVSQIDSEYMIFLNNDIEVISTDWIEAMLEFAQRKDVGAVGALLYYPNKTIQHAGVIVGLGGVAGHSHKNILGNDLGYMGRAKIIQNLSAVTAACLMTKKEVFYKVGGFDKNYSHAFNDVDFCLKIRKSGYLIIYTPYAELYHHESLSRGYEDTEEKKIRFKKEIVLFQRKWRDVLAQGDPYYNPNLTLEREDFSIRL